jgi:hypothetical protein
MWRTRFGIQKVSENNSCQDMKLSAAATCQENREYNG